MSKSRSSRFLLAWAVLVVGLLATVFLGFQIKRASEKSAVVRFSHACDQVTLKIQERLDAYAQVLRCAAGFFAGSEEIGRQEWRAFVETLLTHSSLPGVQGLGFSQVIAPDQLAAHIACIRAEGFSEYTVHPSGERELYTSIIYLEPFRDRNLRAFGYDMFSEPVRRVAMERARDTGKVALSGKVTLVQETDTEIQAGTLMYVPVYRNGASVETVEQRRAALVGWVYSPYRMADFMSGVLGNPGRFEGEDMKLHICDGRASSSADLLFENDRDSVTPILHSPFYQQRTINFGGHQWLLEFDRTLGFSCINCTSAWAVLIGGTVLSCTLCALMLSLTNTQVHAERIALELTRELRKREEALKGSEYRWRFALEGSGDGLWDWDVQTDAVFFSQRWKEMLGFADDEIRNSLDEWSKRVHPDDKAQTMAAVRAHFDGKTPIYTNEHRVRCKDGSWKWILDRGLVVNRDAAGNPLRMIGSHSDISERKQAEEKIKAQLAELQRWQDVMLERVDREQELKREINKLCHRLGESARYPSQETDPSDSEEKKL